MVQVQQRTRLQPDLGRQGGHVRDGAGDHAPGRRFAGDALLRGGRGGRGRRLALQRRVQQQPPACVANSQNNSMFDSKRIAGRLAGSQPTQPQDFS